MKHTIVGLLLLIPLFAGCVGLEQELDVPSSGLSEGENGDLPDQEWTVSDDAVLLYTNRTEAEGSFLVQHHAKALDPDEYWMSAVQKVGSIRNTRGGNLYESWRVNAMGHHVDIPMIAGTNSDYNGIEEDVIIVTGPVYFILYSAGTESRFTIPGHVNVTEVHRDPNMMDVLRSQSDRPDWDRDVVVRALNVAVDIGSIELPVKNHWIQAQIQVIGVYYEVAVEPAGCSVSTDVGPGDTLTVNSMEDLVIHFDLAGTRRPSLSILVLDLPVEVEPPGCESLR